MVGAVKLIRQLADRHGFSDDGKRPDVTKSQIRILEIVEENVVDVVQVVVVKSAHFPFLFPRLIVAAHVRISGPEVEAVAYSSGWGRKSLFGLRR